MNVADGMNYASKGVLVVKEDEFCIAAIALEHGYIYGVCNDLTKAVLL